MTDCEKALWERALVEAEEVNWVRPHRRKQAIARALLEAKAEALQEATSTTPDADGHCSRCGLEWPDERETLELHECPPGFWGPEEVRLTQRAELYRRTAEGGGK